MLKKIPLEIYFLFIPALFTFVLSLILPLPQQGITSIQKIDETVSISLLVVISVLLLFGIYIFWTTGKLLCKKQTDEAVKIFFSLAFVVVSINSALFTIFSITPIIFSHINPSAIAPAGDMLMRIDYWLFHAYSGIIVQDFFSGFYASTFIIICYGFLFLILFSVLFIALIKDAWIFRLGLMSATLAFCIAAPLWVLNPSLPPLNMYIGAKPFDTSSMYTKDLASYEIPLPLQSTTDQLLKFWISTNNTWYGISTNPSMHVAWGFIIVILAFLIWKPFGVITSIWFVGDILGTLLLFQHYFIDLVTGIIIAAASLYIISRLLRNQSFYTDRLFYIQTKMQSDIQEIKRYFVN